MPDGIQIEDMVDLGLLSRKYWEPKKFYQIATTYTNYVIATRFMKEYADVIDGGTGFEYRVLVGDNGSARQTKPAARRSASQSDNFVVGTVPWRMSEWNWQYEYHQILANSGSRTKIVDFLNAQRLQGHLSGLRHLETQGWSKPTDSTDDTSIWGIPFWVVKNATEGFNGGDPSGFSDRGGISSTTYANAKNWTGTYSAVSKTDLIKKIKRAALRTGFTIPAAFSVPDVANEKPRWILCCGTELLLDFEIAAEQQNQQLGNDLAETAAKAQLLRMKFNHVPYLDADTQNPIYMLDMNSFTAKIQSGDNFRESKPIPWHENSDVMSVWTTVQWNMACPETRKNAVLYAA